MGRETHMKLILLPPIPELDRYGRCYPLSNRNPRLHLLLSHLCIDPDGKYMRYYKEQRDKGDYLILDNGADEYGKGDKIQKTLLLAKHLRAQEIVLPDVQHRADATVWESLEALSWLGSQEGKVAYITAGKPRLQIVPQGKTMKEWIHVAKYLLFSVRDTMGFLGGPPCVVGIAKQYETLPRGRIGCCTWLQEHLTPTESIHLLGWAHNLMDVHEIANAYPSVRSVDSAKPFVYSLHGIKVKLPLNPVYPLRPGNYFRAEFPETKEFSRVLAHNLEVFNSGLAAS